MILRGLLVALAALLVVPLARAQIPADAGAINVRDHGAVGDGVHDDTAAILSAIGAAGPDTGPNFWQTRIVYLPKGTYRVSRPLTKRYANGRFGSGLWLVGESRAGTIIRLADRAPGFQDSGRPRGVIVTNSKLLDGNATSGGKDYEGKGEGNDAYDNFVEHLTVDVGSGNPGAIGIDYLANNVGAIRDVTITASPGSGEAGIAMRRKWPGPVLIQNVEVQGFRRSVEVANSEYGVTLDRVRLSGASEAGLVNDGNAVSASRLVIGEITWPVVNRAGGGLITLVQSTTPGDAGGLANNDDIAVYGLNGSLTGVLHGGTFAAKQAAGVTLADAPEVPAGPVSAWVNVVRSSEAGAGDVTEALRRAMATGAATVYLPYGRYTIRDSIAIPATLRRIVSYNGSLTVSPQRDPQFARSQGMLRVGTDGPPLELDGIVFDQTNLGNQVAVQHDGPRTVILRDIVTAGATLLNRGSSGGSEFIEDVCCGPMQISGPAPVVARQLDIEWGKPYVLNHGAPLAILGLKTEGDGTVIDADGGAEVAIMGGLIYVVAQADPAIPAFRVNNAALTASFVEEAFAPANRYSIYVAGAQTVLASGFARHGVAGRVVPWLTAGSAGR